MSSAPQEKGWRRVATHPPATTNTLRIPVEMTDGEAHWETTSNCVPPEDDRPLWWRFAEAKNALMEP